MKKGKKSFNFYSLIKLFTLSITLLTIFTGCENNNTDQNSSISDNFTKFSCEDINETEAIIFMQLDINPSLILGMTEAGKVISIEANNSDADDVMVNYLNNYFENIQGGVELEYVIQDIAEATLQGGYIEDSFDADVTILSGNIEDDTLENAFESATNYLADNDGITASFERMPDKMQDSAESSEDNNNICDLCNGSCTIVCDLCNGEGFVIETEEREVEVRNDYVCPYCGGVGILDDGMHGGETAVCGHCGGEGKTGSMSGDFREKAFNIETIEEEISRPCSRCNGSGILTCPRCEGTGFIN